MAAPATWAARLISRSAAGENPVSGVERRGGVRVWSGLAALRLAGA